MEIFIKEFRTTKELLLNERSNLLSELKVEVNELSKVMSNVLIPKNKVKGVTTRGRKMMSEATPSKEINEIGINKNEPPKFEQDVQEKPLDDGVASSIPERTTQPSVKSQQSSIPFPNMVRKEKEEALQLEEACMETMNKRCSAVLLNELPLKEKDPRSFTIPCQVLEKQKEAEDLAADHLSRFENPHMEVLTEREIADKLSDKHLMVLKSKLKTMSHAVEYVSKWVEAQALPTNDARIVVRFLRSLFARFGVPKALISDRGTHFCNSQLEKALQRYGVTHKLSTTYHPQSNGKTEVTNRAIKRILERSVGETRLMQLNELSELRDGAYENTRIYKERTKKWHDSRLRGDKDFKVGDQVLLYNSRLKMYHGKLKSKWSGPNIVKTVYPHGAIEINDRDVFSFKVNGQRLKKYYGGNIDKEDDEFIEFENGVTNTAYPLSLDTTDLTERKEEIGGVFIIWKSQSVRVLTNLKVAVQHILARKLKLENHLEQHIRGVPRSNSISHFL
ncbi:reverse transcriptase domain-containing protein [Tanacetum coccineum]